MFIGCFETQADTMMLYRNASVNHLLLFSFYVYICQENEFEIFFVCVCVCVWMCVCVCVLGTRMKESNTSYISNSPPFSQKNLNKKARGLAGTLASKQNKKWEYSL